MLNIKRLFCCLLSLVLAYVITGCSVQEPQTDVESRELPLARSYIERMEEKYTLEEMVLNSDVAIVGEYIEKIEHESYVEYKFAVTERIYGDVPDDTIYLYSDIGEAFVNGSSGYSYKLGTDIYTKNTKYLLVLEKVQSIMYDHDRYLQAGDVVFCEQTGDYTMYGKPINLPAKTSIREYVNSVYHSIEHPSDVSPKVIYDDEIAELVGESDYIGVVKIIDLMNEGKVHNGNVYTCVVDSLLKGKTLNTNDDGTILIVIRKNTVKIGSEYIIGFTSSGEHSIIYKQAVEDGVQKVEENLIEKIEAYAAAS